MAQWINVNRNKRFVVVHQYSALWALASTASGSYGRQADRLNPDGF